jgi:hypothetical protein
MLAGCATYQTPGAGVSLANLSEADSNIAEIMSREPAAVFPARIAIARAQAPGYQSGSNYCSGEGRYCVVTVRDIESEEDFERIGALPMVAAVAPLNRIILPTVFNGMRDLRRAAASLKADLLLVYTLDTRFTVESAEIGPLQVVSLGFFPNKEAHVATTASLAIYDVRTGFVYGLAEATARQEQRATLWSSRQAVDSARMRTEAESFEQLIEEFETLWKGIVETYAVAQTDGGST